MSESKVLPTEELIDFPPTSAQEDVREEEAKRRALIDAVLDDPETAVDALQSLGYTIKQPNEE